jgi:hypothetical protein
MRKQEEFEPRMDADGRGWLRADQCAVCIGMLRFEFAARRMRDGISR